FQEQNSLISFLEDSPKPPPRRVTMTLPLLNAAKSLLLVATGASKAPVIKRILEQQEQQEPQEPPRAARLRPRSGRLRWLLDREAAAELREPPGP
ncbi:6-phosphogluconolactonase-like, partial [Camarhynchus parvulus]|uniref:6-phosphogluconolactonase-like n=1 Tax=Geospiza parvula TaxID=87175 RepID=UPI0012382F9B